MKRSFAALSPVKKPTVAQPDNWAALISEVLLNDGKPAGEGWKTIAELAGELGLSENRASAIAGGWLKAGRVERAFGRSEAGRRVNYYRPIC